MFRPRLTSFAENVNKIINERIELFTIKLESYSSCVKTKRFMINMNNYNIRDYVRLKYLLGEPL